MRSQLSRRGQINIVMGLGLLVVMLGCLAFAVDLGLLYVVRTQAQHGVDSGVLAAVQWIMLDTDLAHRKAAEYYTLNRNLPGTQLERLRSLGHASYDYTTIFRFGPDYLVVRSPCLGDDTRVEVSCQRPQELLFARFLDCRRALISARAVGAWVTATGVSGRGHDLLMPWILSLKGNPADPSDDLGDGERISSLIEGQTLTLKLGAQGVTTGNFSPVSINGVTGAAAYTANIINGAQATIFIGDRVTTEPGNMVGPTRQGVQTRLNQGRTRVVVPVSPDPWPAGRSAPMLVIGFCAVELQALGSQGTVIATYSEPVVIGTSSGQPPPAGQEGNVVAPILMD